MNGTFVSTLRINLALYIFFAHKITVLTDCKRYEQYPRLYFLDRRQLPTLLTKISSFAATADPYDIYTILWPFVWSCFPEFIGHPKDVLSQARIVGAYRQALDINQAGIFHFAHFIIFTTVCFDFIDINTIMDKGEEEEHGNATAVYLQVRDQLINPHNFSQLIRLPPTWSQASKQTLRMKVNNNMFFITSH